MFLGKNCKDENLIVEINKNAVSIWFNGTHGCLSITIYSSSIFIK